MKKLLATATICVLAALSLPAFSAQTLTPKQCSGYPFVRTSKPVTHRQLMNELGELEAMGYQPGMDDSDYPNDLQVAQQKLHAEYVRDCTTNVSSSPAPDSSTSVAGK
ncbi:DUF4148 domain-containing protein [Paraburkholderia bannensis]|uniref:DUF4148 domain-containing protein n=1 Tax=Paraburkholderia bannensis TaxID=765414 RepID=UPI000A03ED72|nr:DUF4148 domain-containing protein [Paraburkholderia bannensis]